MKLQNILKRTLFLICALGAFQFVEPVAQAMNDEKIEGEKDNKPKTSRKEKENPISHETSGTVNQDSSTTEKIKIERRQTISGPLIDNLDPKTPTKEENKPTKKNSKSAPSHFNKTEKKTPTENYVQWIGKKDFKLIDANTKFSYSPLKNHEELRDKLDSNIKHFPDTENLFALKLNFLVSMDTKSNQYEIISRPLTIINKLISNEIIFVSGSESKDDEKFIYILSGNNFTKESREEWFKGLYQNSSPNPQSHYHSEQWAMLWLFQNIDGYLDAFCKVTEPEKIYGVFLDGHTWNDPCSVCQEMFNKKVPSLKEKIKAFFDKKNILDENFFVLPTLSSQDWYKSKRLKPLEIKDIEALQCDKRNMGMQLTGMPTRYSIQLCPPIRKPTVNLQNGFQMMLRVMHTSLKYAGQMALSAHDVEKANTGWTKQGFTGVISVFLNRR